MGEQLSILKLIVQASVPVQLVIGILLLASLTSWAIIFGKSRVIGRARREADRFESRFWSGDDLAQLYRAIESAGGKTFEIGPSEQSMSARGGKGHRLQKTTFKLVPPAVRVTTFTPPEVN